MDKPSKKFALVLDDTLPCGVSINTAAHLAAQLGTLLPDLGGREVSDASGVLHSGLPIYPNVVLRANQVELRSRLQLARSAASNGLVVLDYPEQGYTTSTDEGYRAEVAKADEADLKYFGFLVLGSRNKVNEVTKGLKLWACDATQAPAAEPAGGQP